MPGNNTDEAILEEFVVTFEVALSAVATLFVLWGIHISLACYGIHLLWKRGLRKSRPRQCLSGILILMLALGTAHVILVVQFYIVQLPSAMSEGIPPALKRLLRNYNIALDWSLRLNFCLSDLIVIWRAWALWPNRFIHWILGVSMTLTAGCTIANATMITVESLALSDSANETIMFPNNALRALLYIPLMATNILATLLICFKAWVYRKDIRSFTTIDRGSGEISPAYGSGFRVGRILALLIETGVLYIVFMSFFVMSSFGLFDYTVGGRKFGSMWASVLAEIAAIYPTVIIIFVSKFMSQEDAVYSGAENRGGGLPRPNRAEIVHGNGTLSAIQFDMPRLATIPDDREHDKSREKA